MLVVAGAAAPGIATGVVWATAKVVGILSEKASARRGQQEMRLEIIQER
jgi:hypothetical protein